MVVVQLGIQEEALGMLEQVRREEGDLRRQPREADNRVLQGFEGDHQIFEQNNAQTRINSSIEENHRFSNLYKLHTI